MTSRELNQRVGGFRQNKKQVFWLEDEAYIEDIERLGFGSAVLADLRVHHTGGPHYTVDVEGEGDYWRRYNRRCARRIAVKRCSTASARAAPQRAFRVVPAADVNTAPA